MSTSEEESVPPVEMKHEIPKDGHAPSSEESNDEAIATSEEIIKPPSLLFVFISILIDGLGFSVIIPILPTLAAE